MLASYRVVVVLGGMLCAASVSDPGPSHGGGLGAFPDRRPTYNGTYRPVGSAAPVYVSVSLVVSESTTLGRFGGRKIIPVNGSEVNSGRGHEAGLR